MTGQKDGSRRGPFDVDEDRALEALRVTWDDAYRFGAGHRGWTASRADGPGRVLTGRVPDELNAAIRADWGARSTR
jgi:hypothetical protein